jgi:hypothetical protein
MSSKNRKNKSKDSYQENSRFETGSKKRSSYTSSARQKLKEELEQNINDVDEDVLY